MFALALIPFISEVLNQNQPKPVQPIKQEKDYTIQIIAVVVLVVIGIILISNSKK